MKKNSGPYGPKDWNWEGLNKSSITLPKLLQQKGYETIQVGKAHFGPRGSEGENPLNLGFNINIAGNSIGHPVAVIMVRMVMDILRAIKEQSRSSKILMVQIPF